MEWKWNLSYLPTADTGSFWVRVSSDWCGTEQRPVWPVVSVLRINGALSILEAVNLA